MSSRASEPVPYKTRLTGRLISLRECVFERSGIPVRVKKTRLAKNEGFGVNAPDPSPVVAMIYPNILADDISIPAIATLATRGQPRTLVHSQTPDFGLVSPMPSCSLRSRVLSSPRSVQSFELVIA